MASICFYFQVHQPDRLRDYRFLDIKHSPFYLDNKSNQLILAKVANKCYLPMNRLIKRLIRETGGEFKCAFSFSGVFLEQCQKFAPYILESFQELVASGSVEILAETYYHSLSFLYNLEEWKLQISKHAAKVDEIFGVRPTVFRNTELIYVDWLGEQIADLGYQGVLAEGVDSNLGWRSPNYVYNHPQAKNFKILLKNYKLSDDLAFRFSNRTWNEWPLTTEKYINWLDTASLDGNCLNLFMDYETFGEHQWDDSGIFEFMRYLPGKILERGHHNFILPSESLEHYPVIGHYSAPAITSWADQERDLSAWKSNRMQDDAFEELYTLETAVKETKDPGLLDIWRRLTTSDHFYYMCTKYYADGDVHSYFSPYDTPYDAYTTFKNVLSDLKWRLANGTWREEKNTLKLPTGLTAPII